MHNITNTTNRKPPRHINATTGAKYKSAINKTNANIKISFIKNIKNKFPKILHKMM